MLRPCIFPKTNSSFSLFLTTVLQIVGQWNNEIVAKFPNGPTEVSFGKNINFVQSGK